jgi:hypothetical protein
MIAKSLLLSSIVVAASVNGCDGRVELGTGSQGSGASVDASTSFDVGVPVMAYDGSPLGSCSGNEYTVVGTCAGCTGAFSYALCDGETYSQCACAIPVGWTETTDLTDAGRTDERVDPSMGGTCPNISLAVNEVVLRYPPPDNVDNPADPYPIRPDNLDPTGITDSDCDADIHLQFGVAVSGLPCTDTMQVWAGTAATDCTQLSARQANSGSAQCWPVTESTALQSSFSVNLRARDLVAFIRTSKPPSTYTPQGAAACQSLVGTCGAVSLGVYFMAMEADGLTVDGTPAIYSLNAWVGSSDGDSCPSAPGDP